MSSRENRPLILSIRSLRKDRPQGAESAYTLCVPYLDLRLGDKLLVTGPSGCGKSTLLDILGLVLRPDEAGRFAFFPEARSARALPKNQAGDEEGIGQKPCRHSAMASPHADETPGNVAEAWSKGDVEGLSLWRRHVGYVLQTGGLLPFISVGENILTSRRLLGSARTDGFADLPEKLALTLGIRHLLHKFPAQLSVGERQRVAIARALAANPSLVLADEPTAALDPANAAGVLSLFSRMVDELGSTLIMVSHAPEQMRGMGFRSLQVRLESRIADGMSATRAVLCDEAPLQQTAGAELPGHAPADLAAKDDWKH